MTLDEAIQHCEEVSRDCNNVQCSIDHMQLRQWLLELKQYREKDRIATLSINEDTEQARQFGRSMISDIKAEDLIFNPMSVLEQKQCKQ
jgi:hypothetical protein